MELTTVTHSIHIIIPSFADIFYNHYFVSFVHQSDVILESMTVREALALAAHLRLPRSMSFEEKNNRVEEILRWLNLVKCADNQIGSPEKKGISGGERRRVSIGMELVRNVSTLFLDG